MSTNQSKRILVIGWRPGFTKRCMDLGLEVLYIQRKEFYKESQHSLADHIFLIDYMNTDLLVPFAKALYEVMPFQYVVALGELGLLAQSHVNDALGLSNNPLEVAEVLKDKWKMRERMKEANLSPVVAAKGESVEDLRSFAEQHGLPFIVKPVDGSASLGVFKVEEAGQIAEVAEELRAKNIGAFIIEEFLEGPEYSVEAMSLHGKHSVIAITEKMTLPNFVELGHSVPAAVTPEQEQEILATVEQFLDAMGLKEGPSHTELKVTPKGVRIIEGHNRIGGDKINDLVRLATGVDMLTLTAALPYGLAELPEPMPKPIGGSAIRYFTPEPGILREVVGLEEAKQLDNIFNIGIDVAIGKPVKKVQESADRAGFVVAHGRDVKAAVALCEEVMSRVTLITEPAAE